jgi:hypothetical protein
MPAGAGTSKVVAQCGHGELVEGDAVAAAQRQRGADQQRRRRHHGGRRQGQQLACQQQQQARGHASDDEDEQLPGGKAGKDPVGLVDVGGHAHALLHLGHLLLGKRRRNRPATRYTA